MNIPVFAGTRFVLNFTEQVFNIILVLFLKYNHRHWGFVMCLMFA